MKTYKISLGGRGSECFIFPLSEEQYKILLDGDVESEKMQHEDVLEILNVEDVFDADESVLGVYLDEYYVSVYDEDVEIWNSESNEVDIDSKWIEDEFNNTHLVIEDYSKGNFFNFFIETEEEFNPSKLSFLVTEVGQCRDLITSIKYDDIDLSDTKEFDDYWSKGLYYILIKR